MTALRFAFFAEVFFFPGFLYLTALANPKLTSIPFSFRASTICWGIASLFAARYSLMGL